MCVERLLYTHSIHGSVGAITVLGVAHESHDTTIVSTPETKEETGAYIIMTSLLMTSSLL